MKKITIFIGSRQKRATLRAAQEFEEKLKVYGAIEVEYVFLKDYRLDYCTGCNLCFTKGEDHCPLKDDRDLLLEKIYGSDGVIFATPNYAFHVTATMKNFLDRQAFILHRPRFFDKTFTAIVTQGIFGGAPIVKYFKTLSGSMGYRAVKGCCLTTLEPSTPKEKEKMSKQIQKTARRYYRKLTLSAPESPTFFRLMLFRLARTNIMNMLDESWFDYRYYRLCFGSKGNGGAGFAHTGCQ